MSNRNDPCATYEFYVEKFQDLGNEDDSLLCLNESVEKAHEEAFKQFVVENLRPAGTRPFPDSADEPPEPPDYLYWRSDLEKAWHAVAHLLRPN